jgi:arginyl-tRNA synthetase
MTLFAQTATAVADALTALMAASELPAGLPTDTFDVAPPRDASHGDVAINAAMVLAKPAKLKPRDIADKLAAKLRADADVAAVEIAGPGFINLTYRPEAWLRLIETIRADKAGYGCVDLGRGRTANVEYVSANPTGPMHVGHCRGAVFGDTLANLFAATGWKVTREYYINDAGGQVDVLARSAFLRYREALGEDIGAIPEGLYPGDYLKPVGVALAKAHGKALLTKPEAEWLPLVRAFAIDAMLAMIRDDLAALGVRHDVFFSEASLKAGKTDRVAEAIARLRAMGHIYEGRLEKPLGHDADDWEDREQTLFRSTAFGDDVDRALMKSDGSYTYFASDVAYHADKVARGFNHLVNVLGADHVGYVKRIKAVVGALSDRKIDMDVPVSQLVRLMRNGEPVKMSKRAGTFVTLREVVDEVGVDAVRFMMLYRKHDSALDFDLAKVVEQSKENPVFYVQMGHARARSVFRNVAEPFPHLAAGGAAIDGAELSKLTDSGELALIKKLAWYPELVAGAAKAREPHRVAFYLHELASAFHAHWSRGNDSPHLRFIQPSDEQLTRARLALVDAIAAVIASGLSILGVSAPDEMR